MKSRLLIFVTIFGIAAIAVGWVYESNLRPKEQKSKLAIPDDIDYFLTNMNYRSLNADGELDFQMYSPERAHILLGLVRYGEGIALNVLQKLGVTPEQIRRQTSRVLQESSTVVKPGTPLVEIGDPSDLEIRIDVLSQDAISNYQHPVS